MIEINAAQRLKAAKEKVPTKVAVRNWLVKHYGFEPGYTGDSNPYSSTAYDCGVIKDKSKIRTLMKALEDAGFEKATVEGPNGTQFNYSLGAVSIRINPKKSYLWIYTPKKAKRTLRFSPYD